MTSKKTLALAGIASLLLVTACSVPTPTQQAGNTKPGTGTATGSAGVGGSEGKVLGARLRVIRLADGVLLGEGVTDEDVNAALAAFVAAQLEGEAGKA